MRFNVLCLFSGLALAFAPVAFGQAFPDPNINQYEYICEAYQDAIPATGKFQYSFKFDAKWARRYPQASNRGFFVSKSNEIRVKVKKYLGPDVAGLTLIKQPLIANDEAFALYQNFTGTGEFISATFTAVTGTLNDALADVYLGTLRDRHVQVTVSHGFRNAVGSCQIFRKAR